MKFENPPFTNGVMELTDSQKTEIKLKLLEIKNSFEPTHERPICDTFYLVSTYNKENNLKINGDTAEHLTSS